MEFQQVGVNLEIVALAELTAERLTATMVKLDHLTAANANQVVMAAIIHQHVVGSTATLVNRSNQGQATE